MPEILIFIEYLFLCSIYKIKYGNGVLSIINMLDQGWLSLYFIIIYTMNLILICF